MENNKGRKKKEPDYNSPFAIRFRELLKQTKTTLPVLAEVVGVSRQAIGQWKDGNTLPDIVSLTRIADYFNVSADYLLGRSDVERLDSSGKLNAACEVTGLSEKAINNIIKLKDNYGTNAELLLSSEMLYDIVVELTEIERLTKERKYYTEIIGPLVKSNQFHDSMVLNGDKICEISCHSFTDQYPSFARSCNNCVNHVSDADYVFECIIEQFNDIIHRTLASEYNVYSECSMQYQDLIDLESFRVSRTLNSLISAMQEYTDYSLMRENNNSWIYNKLLNEIYCLSSEKRYLQVSDKQLADISKSEDKLKIKALQTYLDKYDENFKLKEQKGESDNGSNNPKKE